MPTRAELGLPPALRMEDMPLEQRLEWEARQCQAHWYRFVAERCKGMTVLDVGAGGGYGMDILRPAAWNVWGIDPGPCGPQVAKIPLELIASRGVDVAVAMDVIEHVGPTFGDAWEFLAHLLWVAREFVFFSTPNYNWESARLQNLHHFLEFTPGELLQMVRHFDTHDAFASVELWMSDLDLAPVRVPWCEMKDAESRASFGVFVNVRKQR